MFNDHEKSNYYVDAAGNIFAYNTNNNPIFVEGVYCNISLHGKPIKFWEDFYKPSFYKYSHRFCGFLLTQQRNGSN